MDLSRYAKHLRGAAIDLEKIAVGALQAAEWRAVGGASGGEFTTARGKVQAAGSRGWIRAATPKDTGLLARSWRGKVEQGSTPSLTLETLDLEGPRYRNAPNGPRKRVSEYATKKDAQHGIGEQVQKFMRRTVSTIIRAAIRKRIATEGHDSGPAAPSGSP